MVSGGTKVENKNEGSKKGKRERKEELRDKRGRKEVLKKEMVSGGRKREKGGNPRAAIGIDE
jgi:hypothetical protein